MAGPTPSPLAPSAAVPELAFAVRGAAPVPHAAAPTLAFAVQVRCADDRAIRSILLDTQIQIAARRRAYAPETHDRLSDLFGPPEGWGTTLHTLLWARVTHVVPPFRGETIADLQVPCTYDLEVAASRYIDALDGGDVPLELLFSGTVFFAGPDGGLQAVRIDWDGDADFRLPVATWRATMDRHFPGCAWVRLGKERFDALAAFRSRRALPGWDDAIDALLREVEP